MPERNLNVVHARDGADHAVASIPLGPEEEVEVTRDGDNFVATVGNADAIQRVERELHPGVIEVVPLGGDDEGEARVPSGDGGAKRQSAGIRQKRGSKSVTSHKKATSKRTSAKRQSAAQQNKGAVDPKAKDQGQGTQAGSGQHA